MERSSNRSINTRITYIWCTLIIELRKNSHTIHTQRAHSAVANFYDASKRVCMRDIQHSAMQRKEQKNCSQLLFDCINDELRIERWKFHPHSPVHCSKFHSCHSPSSRFSVWDTGISTFHFPLFASNFTSFLWWRRAIKKVHKTLLHRTNNATVGWGVGEVEVYRVNL